MNEAKYRDGKWNGRNPINDAGDEMKRSFFDTTDGIDYELWVTKDGKGRIRVTDRDSDENIGIQWNFPLASRNEFVIFSGVQHSFKHDGSPFLVGFSPQQRQISNHGSNFRYKRKSGNRKVPEKSDQTQLSHRGICSDLGPALSGILPEFNFSRFHSGSRGFSQQHDIA